MFGTNVLRKKDHGDGVLLEVQDIFSTIQGEGPFAGKPAVFVRLAGCNLRCYFCDTDFESRAHAWPTLDMVKEIDLKGRADKVIPNSLVVITGGEPMRQNIFPLCTLLALKGYTVQIETAGTLWVEQLGSLIETGHVTLVCSPKTGSVDARIAHYCKHWKYLIQTGCVDTVDGLPSMSTQVRDLEQRLYRPDLSDSSHTIWLQPCEAYDVYYKERLGLKTADTPDQQVTGSSRDAAQTRNNLDLSAELAMKHNYRISIQLHKLLHLP